jgi:hypothetical protein
MKHNGITMFGSAWSWVVPLVAAAGVFASVLWTTPPGFGVIPQVLADSPRGPNADAAAYALGAAASLALVTLLLVCAACGGWVFARRRVRRLRAK